MATKAEIVQTLQKTLTELGWLPVYNKESGMFWKNKCLFTYGLNNKKTVEFGCIPVVHSEFDKISNNSSNSWQIERAGWVVAKGVITKGMGDAALQGEHHKFWSDWQSLIETINNVPDLTEEELFANKEGFINAVQVLDDKQLVYYSGKIRDTGLVFFKEEKKAYQITDVKNKVVRLTQIKPDCSGYLKGAKQIDAEKFVAMEQQGTICALKVQTTPKQHVVKTYEKLSNNKTAKVPEDFLNFGLNDEQLLLLSEGIARGINVTPLLNKNIQPSRAFLEALENNCLDLSALVNITMDSAAAEALGVVIRSKYNLKPYLAADNVDAGYINMIFRDVSLSLLEGMQTASDMGLNNSLIEAIKISRTYGVMKDLSEYVGTQAIYVCLDNYARLYGMQKVAEELLRDGLVSDDIIYMRWSGVRSRKELYSFFSANDLILPNGENWSHFLEVIFERSLDFVFHKDWGFLIKGENGFWGRDYNSIALFDQLYNPIWRAVKVNDVFVSYGNFVI